MESKMMLMTLLLVVGGAVGKDIVREHWKSVHPNQRLDEAPAGAPHRSDVLNTEELQAELLMEYMPFKLPFNLDKYQKVAVVRIMKAAAKPILKSKELSQIVASMDDLITTFKDDQNSRLYLTLALDIIQDLYESKNSSALRSLVHEMFADFKHQDRSQARTFNDLDNIWTAWEPVVDRYMVDPMFNYFIDPFRSYVAHPISQFADRISRYMGVETNELDYNRQLRWSQSANSLVERASDMSGKLRSGVYAAARFLEIQEGRDCVTGVCGMEVQLPQ